MVTLKASMLWVAILDAMESVHLDMKVSCKEEWPRAMYNQRRKKRG